MDRAFRDPPRLGALVFGGDWACAHGDVAALAEVVQQLSSQVRESLHCELIALEHFCHCDPDRATAMWFALKPRVLGSFCAPRVRSRHRLRR